MAKNFNAAQIKELQETFNRFDKDGDGSISTAELVRKINPPKFSTL